jgi:hypothetical protein
VITRTNPIPPSYTARPGEAIWVSRDDEGNFLLGVGRVKIVSSDLLFINNVVADLSLIVHRPEGEEILRRGDAVGKPVLIRKADPPTEPPNAWIIPDDLAAVSANGPGCGSTIVYNPENWSRGGDPRSPSSDEVLLMMLRQANLNASGRSDPSRPDWGDNLHQAP